MLDSSEESRALAEALPKLHGHYPTGMKETPSAGYSGDSAEEISRRVDRGRDEEGLRMKFSLRVF
jgi:hypothetical protein